jgi:glycosyltransferase involved in cell wall biosynthesis
LEPENHIKEIMQGFQRSGSNREMIVVGNHQADTRYVRELRELKDARIRMIGTVYDPEKLISLRYHAFAYMHGHSVGGTNPSLLEAMGCGNLVFAHDNPFNRETLGPSGFYFANADELKAAIHAAEANEGELEPRRVTSQKRAGADYRWADIVSQYMALLELVTAPSKRRAHEDLDLRRKTLAP